MFDARGALSTGHNEHPTAPRVPTRRSRGFVIAGAAARLVLEEYEHARTRCDIHAEGGYGVTSMVRHGAPPSEGRCVHAHGSQASPGPSIRHQTAGTTLGDIVEGRMSAVLPKAATVSSTSV